MCDFIQNNSKCGRKKCYGEYCCKHKREYLVQNNFINISNFTDKSSDYLKNDILSTLNTIDKKKYNKSLKKDIIFNILSSKISRFQHYTNNYESVIIIQRYYKDKYRKQQLLLRGEGFLKKDLCNNKEDFFTYEPMNEIDDKYFFSYKDNNNIIWFFDVRSLKKLIELKQPNPYTMIPFNDNIIYRVNKIIENLKKSNISTDFKDEIKQVEKDKKKLLKQKIIDVFASIERLGLSVDIRWCTTLHIVQLKKLYGLMEDIWNYRAELSLQVKIRMCPPDGRIFNKSPHEIRNLSDRNKMIDYILTDINKFNNSESDSDKRTGFMYFLIALSKVNPLVLDVHPWMASV